MEKTLICLRTKFSTPLRSQRPRNIQHNNHRTSITRCWQARCLPYIMRIAAFAVFPVDSRQTSLYLLRVNTRANPEFTFRGFLLSWWRAQDARANLLRKNAF